MGYKGNKCIITNPPSPSSKNLNGWPASRSLGGHSEQLRRLAVEHGAGTQVRGVMAEGRLSGKYLEQDPQWPADDRRSLGAKDFGAVAPLARAVPAGWTMDQLAVRWALDQPGQHSICLGAKTLADYERAIAATRLPALSTEQLQALRSALDAC